ncbi:hypothetical protein D3C74_307680 [compost metagenome]
MSGSYVGRIAPPGMPKTTSTPASSRERTIDCAPVTSSGPTTELTARSPGTAVRARLSGRAATLAGDGAGFGAAASPAGAGAPCVGGAGWGPWTIGISCFSVAAGCHRLDRAHRGGAGTALAAGAALRAVRSRCGATRWPLPGRGVPGGRGRDSRGRDMKKPLVPGEGSSRGERADETWLLGLSRRAQEVLREGSSARCAHYALARGMSCVEPDVSGNGTSGPTAVARPGATGLLPAVRDGLTTS